MASSAAGALVTGSTRPLVAVPVTQQPQVSFVFVTYGTSSIVVTAITTLVASLADLALTYEVIVVDNRHPTRPHRTINHLLLDTSGVRVVEPPSNLGFGGGCNLGVAHSRGDTLGFVNPDIEFGPGWYEPLASAIEEGAAIAAPVLLDGDGSLQSAGHRLFSDGSTMPLGSSNSHRSDYASAACWLMSRHTFGAVGGFDEAFHPAYYEDVDFALSARPYGGTVVVPSASVVHARGGSTAEVSEPDTTSQRKLLLAKWPELATDFPSPAND